MGLFRLLGWVFGGLGFLFLLCCLVFDFVDLFVGFGFRLICWFVGFYFGRFLGVTALFGLCIRGLFGLVTFNLYVLV